MTNETPENQSPAPEGQHDFGAFTSSAPVEPAAPAGGPAPADSPAEPAAAPATPAAPAAPATPADVQPASEVVSPAPVELPPGGFPAPGAEQTSPYPSAQHPVQSEPQAYPGAQAQAYPGADQTQAYPGAAYPTAAQAGQGYPGAATAAYPTGGYDPNAPQPGAPGYPLPEPAPKKPMSKGLLWGIIGGAAALVLIIAAAIVVPIALRGPQVTAGDVVENYLTAVADGDAEAALEFLEPYGDEDLLTDEVLAASNALAPITDIEIGEYEEDPYSSVVPVTFSVGGETVERDFEVYHYDDDWEIFDGLVSVYTLSGFEDIGLTINGVDFPEDGASLFPGTYELAIPNDAFTFEGETSVFTIADDDDVDALWDIRPTLSASGIETFKTLVTTAINECIAMKTLATPCGWDISDIDLSGATPIEGTVTRTLTADGTTALENLTAEYSSGATVTSYDSISIDMTLEGDSGGQRSTYEVWFGGYMDSPVVDFSTETPTLTWE